MPSVTSTGIPTRTKFGVFVPAGTSFSSVEIRARSATQGIDCNGRTLGHINTEQPYSDIHTRRRAPCGWSNEPRHCPGQRTMLSHNSFLHCPQRSMRLADAGLGGSRRWTDHTVRQANGFYKNGSRSGGVSWSHRLKTNAMRERRVWNTVLGKAKCKASGKSGTGTQDEESCRT